MDQPPSEGSGMTALAMLLADATSESPINGTQEFTLLQQPRREESVQKLVSEHGAVAMGS